MDIIPSCFSGRKVFISFSIGIFITVTLIANTYNPQGNLSVLKQPDVFDPNSLKLINLLRQNDSGDKPTIYVSSKFGKYDYQLNFEIANETGQVNNFENVSDELEARSLSIAKADYSFDVSENRNISSSKLEAKHEEPKPSIDIMTKYRCKCDLENRSHERKILLEQITRINPLYNLSSEEVLHNQHPNLPLNMMKSSKACSSMPPLHNVKWNANYWQVFTSRSGVKYSLYSAFYDTRLETDDAPVVHILTLKNSPQTESLFCNVWFNPEEGPISIKITKIRHIDYQSLAKNRLLPFLLTCPIPGKETRVPLAVSLSDRRCSTVSNILKIIGEQNRNNYKSVETKSNGEIQWRVGICGPALYYFHYDISRRLVDWMETLKAIGVSKVHLYETDFHPNIDKVLRYYESKNFLETIMFSYPEPYINEPNLRRYWTQISRPAMFAMENIYFTDCILRYKDNFRFLSHIDPDEMIIIEDDKSLPDVIQILLRQNELPNNPAAYKMFSTFYPENLPPGPEFSHLPEYLFIMRHSMHFKDIKSHQSYGKVKSIYDTDYAEGVFSHKVLFCNRDPCRLKSKEVPISLAHVAHIRSSCNDECQKKEEFLPTKALIKHKVMIKKNVEKVLTILGLL